MDSTKKVSSKQAALDMDARNKARVSSKKEGGILKRARWGATHRIHDHFVDGFPLLSDRFVREREAAERRYEYNLGSRHFASKADGEAGIGALKALFRRLDRAIGLGDAAVVQALRVDFAAELALWKWRKGARVEFKRRRLAKETEGGDAAAAEKRAPDDAAKSDDDDDDEGESASDLSSSQAPAEASVPDDDDDDDADLVCRPVRRKRKAGALEEEEDDDDDDDDAPEESSASADEPAAAASSVEAEGSSVDRADAGAEDAEAPREPESDSAAAAADDGDDGEEPPELTIADVRRHKLAEGVAVALTRLKWGSRDDKAEPQHQLLS